jgi:hypothetical protein
MGETDNLGKGVPAWTEPARVRKLLDRAWDAILAAGFERAAAVPYVDWMRQYILHHGKRHPQDMWLLTYLAVDRQVSAKSQKQALSGPVFLYETVLGIEVGQLMPVCGRHGQRVAVVTDGLLHKLSVQR